MPLALVTLAVAVALLLAAVRTRTALSGVLAVAALAGAVAGLVRGEAGPALLGLVGVLLGAVVLVAGGFLERLLDETQEVRAAKHP